MKVIKLLLGLIIGITTGSLAQEADSIVVTYDNQRTIIPVPEFGKQTTIKMADSVQMIEISISRRKISDLAKQALYPANIGSSRKPKNKVNWFSEVEAGYTISIPTNSSHNYFMETKNFKGYKLGISLHEKERFINNKMSIESGVNLGFIQSFRDVYHSESSESPSEVFRSSFPNISFPLYFKYHFSAFDLPANIHVGANLVYGYMFISRYDNKGGIQKAYDNGLILVEPRMGIEIGKLGLNIASAWNLFPEMCFYNQIKSINSISLSYRLF